MVGTLLTALVEPLLIVAVCLVVGSMMISPCLPLVRISSLAGNPEVAQSHGRR